MMRSLQGKGPGAIDILYQDSEIVVVDKAAGMHVHKHSLKSVRISQDKIVMPLLRRQIGQKVYPIHRLDAATSGCLLWALSPESASMLGEDVRNHRLQKFYRAVVRGWILNPLKLENPLKSENGKTMLNALTLVYPIAKIEIHAAVGKKYSSARYSIVDVEIKTGRFHQIRRHLNYAAHPVIGDTAHGDGRHNLFFKKELGVSGLCLRATKICFTHPTTKRVITVEAPVNAQWRQLNELFKLSS